MHFRPVRHIRSALRRFIDSEASGGLVLMACAALALVAANSPLAPGYARLVEAKLGPVRLDALVNDGFMTLFFLLVGLEIKREFLHGQLRTGSSRLLPGCAALGGMAMPALIFVAFNWSDPGRLRGWAIPSATDIAFALGVLSLVGDRVPASLKVFVTALAVLDDLGAVLIIALFYTRELDGPMLGAAAVVLAGLVALNRRRVRVLWPYLLLGAALLAFVWRSGLHPTVAGVLLAFTVPAGRRNRLDERSVPLERLEQALAPWVAFAILPVFAFFNAGLALHGPLTSQLASPVTLGVAAGLLAGKQLGVLGGLWVATRLGASKPAGASWMQCYGTALLCGIGFTMSLFVGMLAYPGLTNLQGGTKLGVLIGSVLSALLGIGVLLSARRPLRPAKPVLPA